jgi:hypothetical protein
VITIIAAGAPLSLMTARACFHWHGHAGGKCVGRHEIGTEAAGPVEILARGPPGQFALIVADQTIIEAAIACDV